MASPFLLKVLTFTTLYPSLVRPRHGIFVETRLQHFRRLSDSDIRVVAPVPWFPMTDERFGDYALYARTPREEIHNGFRVYHPRYPTMPGLGMYTQPWAMAAASLPTLNRLRADGFDFDLIDAHYLYPDGVAAAMLARHLGKPLLLTARGSDVNLLPQFGIPRRMILRAARQAGAVITVSTALKERLAEIGVERDSIHVLRNGVDTRLFQPQHRTAARSALGLPAGPVFAAVGNLVPEKGHELIIDAVDSIPGASLVIVGEGPERSRLIRRAQERNIASRVQILDARPQRELSIVYSAADALVLASSREGWPNVLLEAMACGTPVVATAVGGVTEIVADPIAGIVVMERSSNALAEAMVRIVSESRDHDAVRRYAERFGWGETVRAQLELCRAVVRPALGAASELAS